MKNRILYIVAACLVLSSCSQVSEKWVNLDEVVAKLDKEKAFVPYSCELDGEKVEIEISSKLSALDAEVELSDTIGDGGVRRTSSTNAVTLAKSVFSNWNSNRSDSYCGTYMTVDKDGNPLRVSGRIIVPRDKRPNRAIVISHYTIGANEEAPSKSFPLEAILASRGLAVIVPDYIGYGVTSHMIHPYLCANLTAQNVLDMYDAAMPFLKAINKEPINKEVILMGYSQGGATTMAVARKIEYERPDIKIRLVLAGGGPYDLCVTYDKMIENDYTDYPCAIPMIIQGMNYGHNLNLDYSQFFQPFLLENMDKWINSKQYAMADITTMMGTKRMSEVMTKEACNKVSDGMTDLYMAMLDNSISASYYPDAPVYLFHSVDDNVVPFENAESLMINIQGICNVQYNFGHYGNHVAGFLRFLMTSINLLYLYDEIDSKTLI